MSPVIGTMEKCAEELVLLARHVSPATAGRGMSASDVKPSHVNSSCAQGNLCICQHQVRQSSGTELNLTPAEVSGKAPMH